MDDSWILGYDCYNMEIEEGTILRAKWSNDIDIIELEDEDPREYCAIRDKNGKVWAISINDYQNRDLIRKRENIPKDKPIPIIVKPIEEMVNYEIARNYDCCNESMMPLYCEEYEIPILKEKLNVYFGMLNYYLNLLGYRDIPPFLSKYLECSSLQRLKRVGYFCGMDYASKDVYDFSEYISRYDHSLSVCLLVYKLTSDEHMALAALFHDIATPCFSHVIDYMNNDHETQESTEAYTLSTIKSDKYLIKLLESDGITPEDLADFKEYTIVDNNRPKLCADRLDGVILTSIGWTNNITREEIQRILNSIVIYKNQDNEDEIGFNNYEIANRVLELSDEIDTYYHSKEDNYMMQLLANITREAIELGIIKYEDLYTSTEKELFELLEKNSKLSSQLYEFKNIKRKDIPVLAMPKIKKRDLNPLTNGIRIKRL